MDIEGLHKMWAVDAIIDKVALDDSSIKCAKLHSKYLELHSVSRLRLKKKELDHAVLKKDLWLYYNGEMSQTDMDEKGWKYDPFDGLAKPLKSDMHQFYGTDPNFIKSEMQLELVKAYVDSCKEILESIKWKHQVFRNIIAARQFAAGV